MTVSSDLIVDEIKRYREEYAARFNYDLRALVRDVQSRQADDNRRVVRGEPRRAQKTTATQEPSS